jgi:hypothetical protein
MEQRKRTETSNLYLVQTKVGKAWETKVTTSSQQEALDLYGLIKTTPKRLMSELRVVSSEVLEALN